MMGDTATPVMALIIIGCCNSYTQSHNISADVKLCKADPPLYNGFTEGISISLVEYSCGNPSQLESIARGRDVRFCIPVPSTVKFLCETSNNTVCSDLSLPFRDKSRVHQVEMLNDHQTLTTVDFLHPDEFQWLVCTCETGPGSRLVTVGQSLTGYIPSIENFKCHSIELENTTCSWDSQGKGVSWNICQRPERMSDPVLRPYWNCFEMNDTNSFLVEGATFGSTYLTDINGTNKFGNVQMTTNFSFKVDAVQLATVSVSIDTSIGGKDVKLLWTPDCWKSVRYYILCRSIGVMYRVVAEVDDKLTPDIHHIPVADRTAYTDGEYKAKRTITRKGETVTISVRALLPFTNYSLIIQQAVSGSTLWSVPTTVSVVTDEIVPSIGPKLNENGYTKNGRCENARRVTVFWKERDIHNGANGLTTAYSVGNITLRAEDRQATLCIPFGKTLIPIYAYNSKGRSENPSIIAVPAVEQIADLSPCLVRARMVQHHINNVVIDWNLLADHLQSHHVVDPSYTVFWCKQKDNICQEELQWRDVNPMLTGFALAIEPDPTQYRYGVSVSWKSARSGILWAHSVFGRAAPEPKDVELSVEDHNNTHAKASISPRHVNNMAMILSIDLHVCQEDEYGSDKSCKTHQFITSNCRKVVYIRLQSSTFYKFWLSMTYAAYPGIVNTESLVFKMKSVEAAQSISLVDLLLSVGVGAMLVSVGVLAYCIHRRRQRRTRWNAQSRSEASNLQPDSQILITRNQPPPDYSECVEEVPLKDA